VEVGRFRKSGSSQGVLKEEESASDIKGRPRGDRFGLVRIRLIDRLSQT
jgi:hypothetical protein